MKRFGKSPHIYFTRAVRTGWEFGQFNLAAADQPNFRSTVIFANDLTWKEKKLDNGRFLRFSTVALEHRVSVPTRRITNDDIPFDELTKFLYAAPCMWNIQRPYHDRETEFRSFVLSFSDHRVTVEAALKFG